LPLVAGRNLARGTCCLHVPFGERSSFVRVLREDAVLRRSTVSVRTTIRSRPQDRHRDQRTTHPRLHTILSAPHAPHHQQPGRHEHEQPRQNCNQRDPRSRGCHDEAGTLLRRLRAYVTSTVSSASSATAHLAIRSIWPPTL